MEVRVAYVFKSTSTEAPKILIADDDPLVAGAIADRCSEMGFAVETATSGLQALITASRCNPDILVIDVHMPEIDGLSVCAFLLDIEKASPHVFVVTGYPGQEIAERCEEIGARCVRKGNNFWSEFEAGLSEIYPIRAETIKRACSQSVKIEVRKCPSILLVDDDLGVKKFFFSRFENLGAELLYAADGIKGYWTARREKPAVIVSDYCMPNGDAEYLLTRLRNTPETTDIPVIVQTGRRLNDSIKRRLRQPICGQPGAARILQKSFDARELFEALQRFCGFPSDMDGELLYR
jgi:CheY-like chemotaxis protein